jgi:hypothetical protein
MFSLAIVYQLQTNTNKDNDGAKRHHYQKSVARFSSTL